MSLPTNTAVAQKNQILNDYWSQFGEGQNIIDNAATELIRIKQDSTTTDSLKVKIVLLLAQAECSICIEHLVDNYFEHFNHGDGISDIGQALESACAYSIELICRDNNRKWKLVLPLLNSLKTSRDNRWLDLVSTYLSSIFTKPGFKAFVENELLQNQWEDNVYKQNLRKILAEFSK